MAKNSASDSKMGSRRRATKGSVSIESDKGSLRLRFRHQGKRHAIAMGLPDSSVNRKAAENKARQIELDILSGNFDESLAKYKSISSKVEQEEALQAKRAVRCGQLFDLYKQHKAKSLDPRTLEKYDAIQVRLEEFFDDCRAALVSLEKAEAFVQFLSKRNAPATVRDRLTILSSCWAWGIKEDFVELNPWKSLRQHIKVAPKQMPKPFTKEEIRAILTQFEAHPNYRHYLDFVRFLFGTGVRISEAIGLRWQHVADDCSTVWIGEAVSRGVRKSTKTNKDRTFELNPQLQAVLQSRKPDDCDPDDLVFPSPTGIPISDRLFNRRAWHVVLEKANVPYRKPYSCRHTFISHCLEQGMNPVVVAQVTGHDVQTLYKNYAGIVSSRPSLPEIW